MADQTPRHTGRRMEVSRVQDGPVGRIVPRFDPGWDDLTKLEWEAGIVHADTGVDILVKAGAVEQDGVPLDGWFSITIGSMSVSAFRFAEACTYMHGIDFGYRAAQRQLEATQ